MKILKNQREQFNKIIAIVHAMTMAIHKDNREEYEYCIEELKTCLK